MSKLSNLMVRAEAILALIKVQSPVVLEELDPRFFIHYSGITAGNNTGFHFSASNSRCINILNDSSSDGFRTTRGEMNDFDFHTCLAKDSAIVHVFGFNQAQLCAEFAIDWLTNPIKFNTSPEKVANNSSYRLLDMPRETHHFLARASIRVLDPDLLELVQQDQCVIRWTSEDSSLAENEQALDEEARVRLIDQYKMQKPPEHPVHNSKNLIQVILREARYVGFRI